ncbi:hypothetical protein [Amorphus sp. MBR-141]
MTSPPSSQPIAPGARPATSVAAVLILAVAVLVFCDMMTGVHALSLVALALVLVFILMGWRRLRTNTRVLLMMALAVTALYAVRHGSFEQYMLSASRAMYLPALIAVMTLLRIAAQRSSMISRAGYYVVDQPPSRRFLLLAGAGHLFGILLNIGGFLLLMNIAQQTRKASNTSPAVAAIQERRITTAVVRGFAATMMWSPVGIALNILLPILPGLSWVDYLPYGLAATFAFCLLGWIFDRMEPRPRGPLQPKSGLGSAAALMGLVGLMVTITGSAALAETLLDMPLRAAILLIVPSFAFGWVLLTRAPGETIAGAFGWLAAEAGVQLPNAANEICVMTASGYLGMLIATLVPSDDLRALILWSGLEGGTLAVAIGATIVVSSLIGLNPMIPGTVLVASVVAAGLPISNTLLLLAVLTSWAVALVTSPMTSTVAIASSVVGKPPSVIGFRWNGAFALTFFVLVSILFLSVG